MIRNTEEKILDHIVQGIAGMTPGFQDELWEAPVPAAGPGEWYLDPGVPNGKGIRRRYFMSTIAACLVLCMVSVFLFQFMPSASVYLDVNPSVTLQVNYRNRVTKATACNEDAEKILSDLELRGANLDVALYAILGSMVHHGYLTETKDTVLISVHSANENRARELETEVTDVVNQSLDQMIRAGEVLSQQIDGEDIDQADPDLNATPGKAAFIEELQEEYPQLRDENLQDMTIDEIVSLLEKEHLDYSDYLDEADRDDDDDQDDDEDDDDREDAPDDDRDDVPEDDHDDDDDDDNGDSYDTHHDTAVHATPGRRDDDDDDSSDHSAGNHKEDEEDDGDDD